MRKLLLFLLLLGAGLLLLYWLDRSLREGPEVPNEPSEQPAPSPAGAAQGFQASGPSLVTLYDKDTTLRLYNLKSEDTGHEGDFDVLTGVTVDLFDPHDDGVVVVRVHAARARVKRLSGIGLDWEDKVELEDVHAEVLSGFPLAPLTFETPSATLDGLKDPAARRVVTEQAFGARSPELTLTGRGLEWKLAAQVLEVLHGGHVELVRTGAGPATLTARGEGPLRVAADPADEHVVTLTAPEGATLELGAPNRGQLAARDLTLRARTGEDATAGARLTLERLDAEGDVDWTSGTAHFTGQRLAASFLSSARLEHARLDGAPRAEFELVLAGAAPRPNETREQRVVVLEGQDALDITWQDGGYALHVEGPPALPGAPPPERVPTVSSHDFRLQSAGSIDGWLSEDQRSARFHSRGGVVVTSGESTLETPEFTAEIGPDEHGDTVLIGTATGSVRLAGKLPPERDHPDAPPRGFTLTSPDGLKLERSPRGWRVIESTRVEVALEDPGGFHAHADRLSDFVVPQSGSGAFAREGLRFLAQGQVSVDFDNGRFGGEELEVLAVEPVPHLVVRGTPAARAFLVASGYGEATALEIERTGDTLVARGDVTGSLDFESEDPAKAVHTTFSGDELTLDRSESSELLPGERLRILRAQVEGHAHGGVSAGGETLVVNSQHFSAERRERLVAGAAAPLELGSLFIAEGTVHADVVAKDRDLTVDCERFEIERTAHDLESGFRQLTANGNVRFDGRFGDRPERQIDGECDVLVFDAARRGSMEAGPSGRVVLHGAGQEGKAPYRLTAERVDFELTPEDVLRLLALRPEVRMLGMRARAEHFTADDQHGVTLAGDVRVSGATPSQLPFTLESDEVVLVGRRKPEGGAADVEDQLDALFAHGNVDFRLSDSLRARGERLSVRRSTGLLRVEGSPATFEMGAARLETEWVEFDPVLQVLVSTGRGRMVSQETTTAPAGPDAWTVSFLSASTMFELDSVVLVVQEPVFHAAQFDSALRASWAIFWLNKDAFQDTAKRDELFAGLQSTFAHFKAMGQGAELSDFLSFFQTAELAGVLREVYFEGPVEVLADGELLARADALYLDATSRRGWLARATVNLGGQFLGQRQEKLIVKADWLRIASDGDLRADHATVTSCSFEEPHVRVVTGDLRIQPINNQGKEHYRLVLQDNRIEFYDLVTIPLPAIAVSTDKDLQPLLPTLSFADSARFGTLLSFGFTRPADAIGRLFDRLVRWGKRKKSAAPATPGAPGTPETAAPAPKERADVDAHYKINGSYLGSRGGLLDLGLVIEAKDAYWFDLYFGLAMDTGEDKGFVKVDEADRDTLRRWVRSQAYFDHGKSAWSLSYSKQSDAGVQSEFFESQFLRYERSETYVQWRRSSEEWFLQGSAKLRTDDFRSDVEELPSLSGYRGRSPLLALGPLSLIHTGDLHAEYLRRREGSEPHSPFEFGPTFDDVDPNAFGDLDGLGNRDVMRVDTTQALELPVPLGDGWKLTPFVSGRATVWSESVDSSDDPTRFLAEGGARLGTTFWKRDGGKLHQVAPFVEYRAELDREDENGTPVQFDSQDRLLSGDFFRFGSRARLWNSGDTSTLDLDLIGAYATNRSDDKPDGWMPAEVFARLLLEPYGHEFEVYHDGRYDLDSHKTTYSLVSVGTHLGEEWGVQLSHQRGLDADLEPLFEAASISALYRWTEKWEFEGRESFSLLEDEKLDTKILVRRYGHDIVFEIESSVRESEGSSFGIAVKPRFGYRPPRIGYVPW